NGKKSKGGGSIYASTSQNGTLRRSKRHRRSTRSLHARDKSKAHSMGALNLRTSTGSLRSMSKGHHRKSATSLLLQNGPGDTSFNTLGSGGSGSHRPKSSNQRQQNGIYGVLNPSMAPPPPPPPPPPNRHSV